MKKYLSAVIALLLLLSLALAGVSAAGGTESISVTGFNTTRPADSIIIFTSSGETTGTNQWGVEAVVGSDGRIISVGGNDNTVPEGGFVISGHGSGADWIRANCRTGRYARAVEGASMLFVSDEPVSPFYSFALKIDGVNRAPGDGEITVFDSRYGKPNTGTGYGTREAAVSDDGFIVYVSDYSSMIPSRGFIISGKGAGADEVLAKLCVGMKAEFNAADNTVYVVYDAESMLYADSEAADEAYEIAEASERDSRNIDFAACTELYDRITDALDSAAELAKSGTEAELLAAHEKIAEDIGSLRALAAGSTGSEYRAVWVRPSQKTRAAVAEYVQKLYELGANTIMLETHYGTGYIFDLPEGSVFTKNGDFGSFDVLAAYIEECHKRGMELHAWMTVFHDGYSTNENGLYKTRPDLFLKNQNGNVVPDAPGDNNVFLDPSNPETAKLLLELFEYFIKKYDVDALQLDYIRYPDYGYYDDWGYFSAASEKFTAKHGFAPGFDPDAEWWEDWCNIRAGYVTDFVGKVHEMVRRVKPSLLLSADAAMDSSTAPYRMYQDVLTWIRNGWLDMVHPMTYGLGAPEEYCGPYIEAAAGKCAVVPGIGAFEGELGSYECYLQLLVVNHYGCYGAAIFEGNAFTAKFREGYIRNGVYNEFAPAPTLSRTSVANAATELARVAEKDGGESGKALAAAAREYALGYILGTDEYAPVASALAGVGKDAANILNAAERLDNARRLCRAQSTVSGGILSVDIGTDEAGISAMFAGAKVTVKGGMKTGSEVHISCGGTEAALALAVIGDLDGDGVINATDYLFLKRYVLGTANLSPAAAAAAHIAGAKTVGATDYLYLKRHVLGTFDITTLNR